MMNQKPPLDELAHYGVKGMKWGQHKSQSSGGATPSRKVKKADAKFEKNAHTVKTFIEVHNRAAAYTNEHDIDRINNKPQYKNADFSKDSPLRRKYYNEHAKAFNDALKIAANSLGTNASGTRRYTVSVDEATGSFGVHTEAVQHAEDMPFKVVPKFDDKGHIISFSIQEVTPIKHYGVKGMHWGVRKNTPTNENYNRNKQDYDRRYYGQGGVKRINRRLNSGTDLATARNQERKFRRRRRTAVSVGFVAVKNRKTLIAGAKAAGTIIGLVGGVAAQHIAVKAEAKRGQAAAANIMGLPSKPTNGPTYAKKSRGGAHKITSL